MPRTILITGAGSGLGRGLALCLAKDGHAIIATDLDLSVAREIAALMLSCTDTTNARSSSSWTPTT